MVGAAGQERLSEDDCLRLLEKVSVGRIVYTERAMPAIQPVNFVVDEKSVIVRTTERSSLATAARGAVVAFEVDEFHADGTGWSVVAVGNVSLVSAPGEVLAVKRFSPLPWTLDEPELYLRVDVKMIIGRRMAAGPVAGPR